MNHRIIKYFILAGALAIVGLSRSFAQDHAAAFAAADSSNFSVNSKGGWKLFNSYVASYNEDSLVLEFIVQHDNTINWREEQYVGRVKTSSLIPVTGQTVSFNLLADFYTVRIDRQGRCFLRLASGSDHDRQMIVIPARVFYRK